MNHTILITGASRGIGRSIALSLAKEKFDLLLWARSYEDLKRVQEETETLGIKARIAQVDVADPESIQNNGGESLQFIQSLKGVIINAGIGEWTPFEKTSLSEFKKTLDVNLIGAFLSVQQTLPLLRANPYSRLVVIGSDSSEFGFRHRTSYCSSKWGLYGFIESLREEIREDKIHITHLLTSRVDTYFRNHVPGDRKEALLPDHIGQLIAFLFTSPEIMEIREIKVGSIHLPYGKSST